MQFNDIFDVIDEAKLYNYADDNNLSAILFNIQFNDIFDVIDEAKLYNYADDNNLSAIGDSTIETQNILKQQTTDLLERFDQNDLIANPLTPTHSHLYIEGYL